MSNRTPYEGDTQRFTDYNTPSESTSTARFDDVPAAPAAPPAAQPYHQGRRRRGSAPLLGLSAIVIGVALLVNSGRLPVTGGFIERSTTFSENYAVQKIELDVGNGNVRLARATGDEIELEAISHGYGWTPGAAERAAERVAPEISIAGDTLRIQQDSLDRINLFGRSPFVEYRIAVPDNIPADITVGSGDIEGAGLAGVLTLDTGSGNIALRGGQGTLDAETGSGDIELEGILGELRVSTGSGNITISGAEAASSQIQTGSGNIEYAGSLQAEGTHSISTGSGNIDVELPEDANVDLSAGTGSGEIRIDDTWPATVEENSATARLGNGGTTLELRTSSGDISVEAD